MPSSATFTGPGGADAHASIQRKIQALNTTTTGDMLYVGQIFRSRIRKRTLEGVDVDGAPFAAYSKNGPYYFYPNGEVGSTRRAAGTSRLTRDQVRQARSTATKGRFAKTGRIGVRTPFGIRYESYGAGKAAHGVANVNLYGMEQHTHMLDVILVKVGGVELDQSADMLMSNSDMAAFESNQPARDLEVGFYGPEAERARGNNEGNSKLTARRFFALNQQDLAVAEQAIGNRMEIRARNTA